MFGPVYFYLGEFSACREHTEQASALYNAQQHRALALLYVQDPGVFSAIYGAWTLQSLGFSDEALRKRDTALSLARELSHPYSLVFALNHAARLHQWRREASAAQIWAEEALALCKEQGFGLYGAVNTILQGWAFTAQGQGEEGIALMRQGLDAWRGAGAELNQAYFLALLAEGYGKAGQIEEGLGALAEALARVEKTGERFYEAELHRLKGALLLQQPPPDASQAESCFLQATEVARRQQAKWLELRASVSMSRLWQEQGKQEAARQMLAEVYDWFTEGFDTPDLKEAKALLEEIS
jgi:predicted ATPase